MKLEKSKIFAISFAAAAACLVMAGGVAGTSAGPAPDVPGDRSPLVGLILGDETLPADSLAADTIVITPDSLLNRALEAFKNLKFQKMEGEGPEVVAPLAYNCYLTTLEAMNAWQPDTREWAQAKEILRENRRDILSGAFHFSKIGNQADMSKFARAYLDISLLDAFRDETPELDPETLGMVSYIGASNAYNAGEYAEAIDYFKLYLSTGDDKQRERVYIFMTQACLQDKQWDLGISTADEALTIYPGQKHILLVAMQICIDGGRGEHLQRFLDKALEASPSDERLLDIRGKLLEDAGRYEEALAVYNSLDQLHPNSLSTAKHLGVNYYNMAVGFFNEAINEEKEKTAIRLRRKAKNYFASAADKFREVLAAAPTAVPYLRSLGVCYLCLEDKYNFEKINERLKLLKEDPLAEVFMPPPMTYNGTGELNFAQSQGSAMKDAPSFSTYGRDYITSRLDQWARKGEFEKTEDYTRRVNEATIRAQYDQLKKEAADKYLAEYSSHLRINDLYLQPYDATNEVFKIVSSFGPIYLRVPIRNGEAEAFKDNWKSVRFQSPRFFIDEDSVRVAEITFLAANGKKYEFNNARALDYSVPEISIDFASILASETSGNSRDRNNDDGSQILIAGTSDVDKNIPVTDRRQENTLALVIANENYKNVANVPSAFADGNTFKEYCKRTLGIPEDNISFCRDASLAEIYDAMSDLQRKAGVIGSQTDVIVYYAGHGLPDEHTSEAYLLATDANPTNPRTWYKLSDFYNTLAELNAASVVVFLDACFSGAERSSRDAVIGASGTRGVAIKPKEAAPRGNMFVMSAASSNESALPYTEKNHGLFTYFLLKKLQETKGNVNLKDLSDYVIDQVVSQSTFQMHKTQTPTVVTSGAMTERWKSKKLYK